jgi:hypothetical protein
MTDGDVGASRDETTDADGSDSDATDPDGSGTDTTDRDGSPDDTTGTAPASDERTDVSHKTTADSRSPSDESAKDSRRSREVVVPMPIYKIVTVFSTLIAVVGVVFGFMLLDAATLNVSFLGNAVRGAFTLLGIGIADGLLSAVFAAVGLAMIAFGAGVYVLGTRFRARGMGNAQEGSDEDSNNDG